MSATYTKLRSGDWGIRVDGRVNVGDVVEVVKKSGERKRETVARVVWSGQGVTLAAIERSGAVRTAARSSGPRMRRDGTYECDECGDYVYPGTRCWETGHTH